MFIYSSISGYVQGGYPARGIDQSEFLEGGSFKGRYFLDPNQLTIVFKDAPVDKLKSI